MWAVRFEGVSKEFSVNQTKYRSVRADVVDLTRRISGRPGTTDRARVTALSDLNLEIEEGTTSAIVGRNGAGKSTALRLISRITYPSTGRVRVRGRVGALIEVGAGVHPELSGRENIGLYGSFLGLSRADIRRRFDEIVDFAEIEGSVDTAVKYYSTGMKLRLGFAIAAFLEPAIFIVDESLAVGDGSFQAKCINRMQQLGRDGATIVFVSHELASVEALCQYAYWLDRGQLIQEGPIGDVLRDYSRSLDGGLVMDPEHGDGEVQCLRTSTFDGDDSPRSTFRPGDPMTVRLTLAGQACFDRRRLSLRIRDGQGDDLIECVTEVEPHSIGGTGSTWTAECRIASLPLNPRMYQLWCSVADGVPPQRRLDWTEVGGFRIEIPPDWVAGRTLASVAGPAVAVEADWRVGP
jgi:ABC-type polysaccharide/polyol phosphate transport system ATPase subunit